MIARGDRKHDIAAWFGLNQGRITEVEDGVHGSAMPAPNHLLPPAGSPGPKARKLRRAADGIRDLLQSGDIEGAIKLLDKAIAQFDKHE
jgi:hypothetical protein